jgi:hypothetical protein
MTRLRPVEGFARTENLKDAIHPWARHGVYWGILGYTGMIA